MKDLRIIIVTWNSEKHLEACLSSLPASCDGLNWEVIVVDNASKDKSVEIAGMHDARVIANKDNRGFAKACNQGLEGLDARYVVLLNPDTECPPKSLAALVHAADKHPNAGIMGPKLLNTDGSAQTSIRRFPGFWNQAGVMLKLHNFFPGLFRRYFAADLSLDQEQDVDQIMGACFLIKREVIDQIGGLDERYFIWFEEVDYCKQAQKAGWTVRYVPSVHITHHGGQSFAQVFAVKKQGYLNRSLVAYFRKWHSAWQANVLWALQPVSIAFAWLVGALGMGGAGSKAVLGRNEPKEKPVLTRAWRWLLVILALELVSSHVIFVPTANTVACISVGIIIAVLAYKRPTLALSAIVMELMIGSQGHLLQIGTGFISIRSMMFVAFFVGWGVSFLRNGSVKNVWGLLRERIEWVVLGLVVVYAFVRGVLMQNAPIIADTNAWVFIAMIVPVLDLARREGERLKNDILPVLILAPLWLGIRTLGLEYLYAHGLAVVDPPSPIHLWIRRTGTGEITPLGRNEFRVFMQSFVFMLPALFMWASRRFATHDELLKQGKTAVTAGDFLTFAGCVSFIVGMSRSLAVGLLAGGTMLVVLHLWKGGFSILRNIGQVIVRFVAIFILAWAMSGIARNFPVPQLAWIVPSDSGSRIATTDPASNSRRMLLNAMIEKIKQHPILGSGLGATVTYKSSDPRVLAQNPNGLYTTYAFEWGWLDHWIKFGIVGFILMIVLVCRLGLRLLRMDAPNWMKFAGVASLVGLAVTHVFTPYLNHPLGLGYLMMLEGFSELTRKSGT